MKLSLVSTVNTNTGRGVWLATLLFALVACQPIALEAEPTSTPSGLEAPYPPPATEPLPTQNTAATEPLPTQSDRPLTPTATLPGRSSITISAPTRLDLPPEIQKISFTELLGDNLVGQAVTEAGFRVALINIANGQTKFLSGPSVDYPIYPQITKDAVVWLEPSGADLYKVQVYNLENEQITTPYTVRYAHKYDFDADTLLFSDYRDKQWGLYTYQISTATETHIAEGSLGCAQLSYPWATYAIMDFTEDHQPKTVSKLMAYNLETQETLALGDVFTPRVGEPCDAYKLDANDVVWLDPNLSAAEIPLFELHAYDLARRAEQVIERPEEPSSFFSTHVLVSQHVLVLGTLGADLTDLRQGMSFYLPMRTASGQTLATPWFFSEGHLVWGIIRSVEPVQLYTATIIR